MMSADAIGHAEIADGLLLVRPEEIGRAQV
jgi:hypothetical protein